MHACIHRHKFSLQCVQVGVFHPPLLLLLLLLLLRLLLLLQQYITKELLI